MNKLHSYGLKPLWGKNKTPLSREPVAKIPGKPFAGKLKTQFVAKVPGEIMAFTLLRELGGNGGADVFQPTGEMPRVCVMKFGSMSQTVPQFHSVEIRPLRSMREKRKDNKLFFFSSLPRYEKHSTT